MENSRPLKTYALIFFKYVNITVKKIKKIIEQTCILSIIIKTWLEQIKVQPKKWLTE